MFRKRELTEEEQEELEQLRKRRREEKKRRKEAEEAARKARKRDIREVRQRVWSHYPLTDQRRRERQVALRRFMSSWNRKAAHRLSRRRLRNLGQRV